jgi:hypothetical protein
MRFSGKQIWSQVYRPVHVKTLRSQKLRMLLTHRKLLQSKAIAVENDLRATLATRSQGTLISCPVGATRMAKARFGSAVMTSIKEADENRVSAHRATRRQT